MPHQANISLTFQTIKTHQYSSFFFPLNMEMHALAGKRKERFPSLTIVTTFLSSGRLLHLAKAPAAVF